MTTATEPSLGTGGYHLDGRVYPRVTSILQAVGNPGLSNWKAKVGYAESERLARLGAELGTRVHRACWAIATGEPAERVLVSLAALHDDDLVPYVEAFAEWFADSVLEVLGAERVVWSERYVYAGTADLLAVLYDGRRAVLDLKTSGSSLSDTYRLQLSAYQLALAERDETYDARMVLWLPSSKPGRLIVREYDDHDADYRAWRAALAIYRWQQGCRDDWKTDKRRLEEAV